MTSLPKGKIVVPVWSDDDEVKALVNNDGRVPVVVETVTPAIDSQVYGWDGSLWRKLAMIFGYSDRYVAQNDVGVDPADSKDLDLLDVDDGEIWVVNTIVGICSTANPTQMTLNAVMGGIIVPVYLQLNVTAWTPEVYNGALVLKKDDFIRGSWTSCSLNDHLYIKACGYKMKVAE